MLFSFAVALYLPLLARCTPTMSPLSLPPPLKAEKLSLVRANAIHISNRRSVHVLPPEILSHW